MADIIAFGDKHKRLMRIAEGWFRKKTKASIEAVHKDLSVCGNPTFTRLYNIINDTAYEIKEEYQSRVVRNWGSLILWILYKDTAYRDVILYIIYNLCKKATLIMKEIEPYLKEPSEWYVNSWHDSKQHSKKGKANGTISSIGKAEDESIFTPAEQAKRLNRL